MADITGEATDPMPRAVYTDAEDIDVTPGAELLRRHGFDVEVLETRDHQAIGSAAADADVLLVGYANVDEDLLARLPRLKIVSLLSMGFDNVDVPACTRHGVWVATLPNLSAEEVATHVLAMALALIRNLPFYQGSVRAGRWGDSPATVPPRLSETSLGIIGLGNIGRQLARICRPLFGRIVGYDALLPRTADARLAEEGITRVGLDELTSSADVISLHVPLLEATRGMVDSRFLARMRPGGYLLNASRGALVNTADACRAIAGGRLAGLGMDVFETEPLAPDDPLTTTAGNILLTPHVGYLSTRTLTEYVHTQADNVLTWHTTGRPAHPVNTIPALPPNTGAPSPGRTAG